jgi:hypothetical protein
MKDIFVTKMGSWVCLQQLLVGIGVVKMRENLELET